MTETINGVIAMGGGPLSGFAIDSEPIHTYVNMTKLLGCDLSTSLDAVRCLQGLPVETLIDADNKFQVCNIM